MRKFVITFLLWFSVISSYAYVFESDGIYYGIDTEDNSFAYVIYKDLNYNSYSGDVVIPSTVTYNGTEYVVAEIGNYAFKNCSGLTSIVIPNSITAIREDAFFGCSSLTSIFIPESVRIIQSGCFAGCSGLLCIKVDENNTRYSSGDNYNAIIEPGSNQLVAGCRNTVIPSSVNTIGKGAFWGCADLKESGIHNGITQIYDDAYKGCVSLTSVIIPKSVTKIKSGAFSECSGLKSVEYYAADVIGPEGYETPWFSGCSNITSFTIGDEVKSIPDFLCKGLIGIESITIPNSVTFIGVSAFHGCTGLKSVEFGNSISNIRYWAFWGCTGLTTITIPKSVTALGNKAFAKCTGLTKVVYDAELPGPRSGEAWFKECSNIREFVIGDNVKNIPDFLCEYCKKLESITIPNHISSIGIYAFYGCESLTSIVIPESVSTIGIASFSNCSGLTYAEISNSVSYIGGYTFKDCINLQSVKIGSGLKQVYDYAFDGCQSLNKLDVAAVEPPICDSYAFQGVDKSICELFVPEESVNLYKEADVWKDFYKVLTDVNKVRIDNSVISIESGSIVNSGNANIRVYDINGLQIYCGNQTIVPLEKGLYIIRAGKDFIKVKMK